MFKLKTFKIKNKYNYFLKKSSLFFLFSLSTFPQDFKSNIIQEIPTIDEIHEEIFKVENNNNNNNITDKNNSNNIASDEKISQNNETIENKIEESRESNSLQKELNQIHDSSIKATSNDLKLNKNKSTIDKRENKFSEMTERSNRVTALGSAMGAIDLGSTPTNKIRFGAGVGNSSSSQAVAVGVGYAPTANFKINTKFSSSTNNLYNNSISVGASYDLDI